jgi:hypothetical protein
LLHDASRFDESVAATVMIPFSTAGIALSGHKRGEPPAA